MSPRRARLAALLVAVLAWGASPALASDRVRVDDLVVEPVDGVVTVGYRLEGSMPEEVIERLDAGMVVTVRHRVELVTKRNLMLSPSRLVQRCDIATTARFDSLTKQYRLERTVRYRTRGEELEPATESRTTAQVEDVRRWLTVVDGVALPLAGLAPGQLGRARVRVSSDLGRRWMLYLFPVTISASAEVRLGS